MSMGKRLPVFIAMLGILPAGLAAPPDNATRSDAERIESSILVGSHVMDYERGLTDGFGGRLTGSTAYNRAAEWAAEQFRAAGIKNVRLELFTMEHGWQRGTASGRLVAPMQRPLHLQSLGWAPSTPAGGVSGEVVEISDVKPERLKARAASLKDRLVMLDVDSIFADGWKKALPAVISALRTFKEAGARGVIVPDNVPDQVMNATSLEWGSDISPLPVAELGMEDAKLVQRLLKQGPVTVEFELHNQVSGPMQVSNVVAEIPGSARSDQWVIVGAHLDSWDYATGAQDNGTGTAMVLDVARALAALGRAPRRSIRFALWGGEEQGLLGSYAYTQRHKAELAKCVAVVNTDNGAGHPKGWKVESREDVRAALQPISEALLSDLGADQISKKTSYDTDHGPFMLAGIPALDLWVDMSGYGNIHHKISDTYDKVDPMDLKTGSAIVAVTAYAIANQEEPLARHLDHGEVEQLLKDQELHDLLKFVGQWQ